VIWRDQLWRCDAGFDELAGGIVEDDGGGRDLTCGSDAPDPVIGRRLRDLGVPVGIELLERASLRLDDPFVPTSSPNRRASTIA
jgi:hypothetical protein